MKTRLALLPLAAALAAWGAPALAQHHPDHSQHPSKPSTQIAEGVLKSGVREIKMEVTGDGFVPARIKALKGEKVRLLVTRKTDRTCATDIVVKDQGIKVALPLDKQVTVDLVAKKSGEIQYACAWGHIRGVIFIP
jgi:plastocyanin domain-containing protein